MGSDVLDESFVRSVRALLGLEITPAQIEAFRYYVEELLAWNRHTNLTAITDLDAIMTRHLLDSLSCLLAIGVPAGGLKVIDVGTGAGFPGLPLKIVYPVIDLTLLEATGKKTQFLEHVVAELGLQGVTIITTRAEEAGHMPGLRERYDWVLARAVAHLRTLAEYLLPLCRVGGVCLAQKGKGAAEEVQEAAAALDLLGGVLRDLLPVHLPGVEQTHYLVLIDKTRPTPAKYPRRPGMPTKRPL